MRHAVYFAILMCHCLRKSTTGEKSMENSRFQRCTLTLCVHSLIGNIVTVNGMLFWVM